MFCGTVKTVTTVLPAAEVSRLERIPVNHHSSIVVIFFLRDLQENQNMEQCV